MFVHHVALHGVTKPLSVSVARSLQHGFMLFDRLGSAFVRQIHHEARASDTCGQKLVLFFKYRVVRAVDHCLMYVLTGLKIPLPIPCFECLKHRHVTFLDPPDASSIKMSTGQFTGQLFKSRQHRKGVLQLFAGDLCDARAPIGFQDDKTFGGEHLERFAQGGT